MQAYWQSFLDFLFPRTCVVCLQRGLLTSEKYICSYCLASLPFTDYHIRRQHNPMYERLLPLINVEAVFTLLLFTSGGKTQKILHAIKYKNQPELAQQLGRWLGRRLEEQGLQHQYDVVLPIPLYSKKLIKRGYNQSAYFAKGLAEVLQLDYEESLIKRIVATDTQTKKSRLSRWKNVGEVFVVTEPERVEGKRILLVDDVITTGATIASCGQVLLNSGAKSLTMASIASA
jgi:ComF family protein